MFPRNIQVSRLNTSIPFNKNCYFIRYLFQAEFQGPAHFPWYPKMKKDFGIPQVFRISFLFVFDISGKGIFKGQPRNSLMRPLREKK